MNNILTKKRKIVIIIIVLLSLFVCLSIYVCSNNTPSIIPHRGLEKAIREQIGKPTGIIMPEDCLGVTELNLNYSNYNTNLEGLQYFVNLEKLTSTAGRISDISALSELTKLNEINLYENRVKDLTPLSGLTNLEVLILQNNNVLDLTPLESVTNLKKLVIGQNPVEYIPNGFAPLSNLYGLSIGAYADYTIIVRENSSPISPLLSR